MQGLLLFIALATTQLSTPNIAYADQQPLIRDYVAAEATLAGANVQDSLAILDKESTDCQMMIGDHGTSLGCWQIHLPAHPDISKQQAMSIVWSTEWSVKQLADGKCSEWSTCPH